MANDWLLISNALSNDRFLLIRLAKKRKSGLDKSREIKAGANSSNIIVFFLWFNSIQFCLPGLSVTTDPEKADDPNTGAIDADKRDTGIADPEEANRAKADKTDIKRAEEPGIGIAD